MSSTLAVAKLKVYYFTKYTECNALLTRKYKISNTLFVFQIQHRIWHLHNRKKETKIDLFHYLYSSHFPVMFLLSSLTNIFILSGCKVWKVCLLFDSGVKCESNINNFQHHSARNSRNFAGFASNKKREFCTTLTRTFVVLWNASYNWFPWHGHHLNSKLANHDQSSATHFLCHVTGKYFTLCI